MKAKKYVVPTIKARNIQPHIMAGSATGEIDPWQSKQSESSFLHFLGESEEIKEDEN